MRMDEIIVLCLCIVCCIMKQYFLMMFSEIISAVSMYIMKQYFDDVFQNNKCCAYVP